MSEHKSAAHITGVYVVLAAIVGGLVTAFFTWQSPPTGQSAEAGISMGHQLIELPDNNAAKPSPIVEQVASPPPKIPPQETAEAVPTSITMESYFHLLEDEGVPPLEVVHQYIGKRVRWTGYFHSMDVYSNAKPRRYRILMVWDPEKFRDYLYFNQEESEEPDLRKLRKGMRFTITGILGDLTRLDDAKIESIDEPQ